MTLAPPWHRSHQPAPARPRPDDAAPESWLEGAAVYFLRGAALVLVGYLGTVM